MVLDDWYPEEFLSDIFDKQRKHITAQINDDFDVTLEMSGENSLRIYASVREQVGQWRYRIVVTKRLINLINRYFFCMARSVPSINEISIPNSKYSGLPHHWFPEIETFETFLLQVPDETIIADERVELFVTLLKAAWDWLLMHEFFHIVSGHLRFISKHPDLFSNNHGFSRAMELEADDAAARWLSEMLILEPPQWLAKTNDSSLLVKYPVDFAALTVSNLYYVMRIQSETKLLTKKYLAPELRQLMAVATLISKQEWTSKQAMLDASINAMTNPTKTIHYILGISQPKNSIFVSDIDPNQYAQIIAQTFEEYKELRHYWRGQIDKTQLSKIS